MVPEIILLPVTGAVIGYITNFIAVRMLFFPKKAVYIGKVRLPFTPGVIPRNKEKTAEALGDAVAALLTKEDIEAALLGENAKDAVRREALSIYERLRADDTELKAALLRFCTEAEYADKKEAFSESISRRIMERLEAEDMSELFAAEAAKRIRERLDNTFFGSVVSDRIIAGMTKPVGAGLQGFILEHGKAYIKNRAELLFDEYEKTTVSRLIEKTGISGESFADTLVFWYERAVESELSNILNIIDIKSVVREKISAMDIGEIEELLLSIIKRELSAVVNLGAVIGFVLGLIMTAV